MHNPMNRNPEENRPLDPFAAAEAPETASETTYPVEADGEEHELTPAELITLLVINASKPPISNPLSLKPWRIPLVRSMVPAISLLGILIPFSGIGNKTAVIALTVYGIMPMVHNTYVGLTTLDPDILEAARGMGSTGTQALFRVKLPMAAGVILAGVRNMVVMTISVAGIASFVGAGGLGVAVYRGITIYDPAMTAAGSILIALLAIVCDLALGALERYFKKRGS